MTDPARTKRHVANYAGFKSDVKDYAGFDGCSLHVHTLGVYFSFYIKAGIAASERAAGPDFLSTRLFRLWTTLWENPS